MIAFPCPTCQAQMKRFEIDVSDEGQIILKTACNPCTTIFQLAVTLDDLQKLGRGQPVELRGEIDAQQVM